MGWLLIWLSVFVLYCYRSHFLEKEQEAKFRQIARDEIQNVLKHFATESKKD